MIHKVRPKLQIFLFVFVIQLLFPTAFLQAERESPKAGDVASYYSANKQFQLDIILQPIVIDSPSEAVFKKDGQILWKKKLSATPGFVNISDDGQNIVMANWGWYDEGGFKNLTFYDGNGTLLRELNFHSPTSKNMRWIHKAEISENGKYYVIGNNGKEMSEVTLYDVTNQKELWTKLIGLESIGDIQISKDGKHILTSTYNWNCTEKRMFFGLIPFTECRNPKDVEFAYLDEAGNMVWNQKFENGYGWEQKFIELNGDGLSFKIFDLKNKQWLNFVNQEGIVKPVS